MKIILSGGGDYEDMANVNDCFAQYLTHKKMLCLIQAAEPEILTFDQCFDWIKNIPQFEDVHIGMWASLEQKEYEDLSDYDGIYIMGGDTLKLINAIKSNHFEPLLMRFLADGKPICGMSAGAIIMGSHISTIYFGDDKEDDYGRVSDLSALNFMKNTLITAHYSPKHDSEWHQLSLQENKKIIALPDASGILYDGVQCKVLGADPVTVFENAQKSAYTEGVTFFI
jgi:dipeptidase E